MVIKYILIKVLPIYMVASMFAQCFSVSTFAEDARLSAYRKNTVSDPFILGIRKQFDSYLNGSANEHLNLLVKIAGVSKEVLAEPFLVFRVDGNIGGGSTISLIPYNQPSMIVDVWVYELGANLYEIRLISIIDLDEQSQRELLDQYGELLEDRSLGI